MKPKHILMLSVLAGLLAAFTGYSPTFIEELPLRGETRLEGLLRATPAAAPEAHAGA